MPLYASSLYNSAGVNGGDAILGRDTPVTVYDYMFNADKVVGGWTLPDVKQLVSDTNPPPSPESIAELGKTIGDLHLIAPDDAQKLSNLVAKYKIDPGNPEHSAMTYFLIGISFLYDTYRLLSLEEVGKKKFKLDKQQMMLARNRAALLTILMANVLQRMNNPMWNQLGKEIYDVFHVKRGVTRAELIAEMAENGYYTGVNESLLPQIDQRGYGSGKNVTPWSTDWNKLTPELAARAVRLLNKTTKHGIALDPDTLAKAAQGYVPPELIEKANKILAEEKKQKKKSKKKKTPSKAAAAPVKAKRAGKRRRLETYDDGIVYPVYDSDDEDEDEEDVIIDDIIYPSSKKTRRKTSSKKQAPKKGSREAKLLMAKVRASKNKKGKRKAKGGSAIWDEYFHNVFHYDKHPPSPFSGHKDEYTPGLIWRRA